MSGFSSQTSSSQSTSEPIVTETPENQLLDQIAGIAQSLGQQMAGWAQGVYAKTSQITDQAVGNFFNVSQQMMGFSNKLADQYNNLFAPENAQLIADANSYASPSRMQADMGMAGATAAQAGQAAMRNSEQQLASFGIDPSSGRYAALDKADAVQNAANVAGAENMQRMEDIKTGQQLRSEAVQVGSLLPAAVSNTANTAIQANAGASNASLANANTGANLMSLANQYLSTAMGLKLPLQGQKSQSTSSGQGSSSRSDPGRGGNGSGAGNGGAGAGGGAGHGGGGGWNPQHGSGPEINSYGGGQGGDYSYQQPDMGDFSYMDGYGSGQGSIGDQTTDPLSNLDDNPFNDPGFGQTYGDTGSTYSGASNDSGSGSSTDMSGLGDYNYDPSANATDPGWGQTYDQPGDPSVFDSGSDSSYAGGGSVHPNMRRPRPMPRPKLPHGQVPFRVNAADGGQISPQMSPSGGQQTDDVPANLNTDEFVVPKDVAKWKGEEFFHKMIADSRNKRHQMAAALGVGPTVRPQPGGR